MDLEAGHIVPYRTFIFVWITLMVLTLTTVLVSRMDLGPLNIWVALGIACFKSGLVIFYFMHMQYERLIFRAYLFVALLILAIFIGLTFFDVLYR